MSATNNRNAIIANGLGGNFSGAIIGHHTTLSVGITCYEYDGDGTIIVNSCAEYETTAKKDRTGAALFGKRKRAVQPHHYVWETDLTPILLSGTAETIYSPKVETYSFIKSLPAVVVELDVDIDTETLVISYPVQEEPSVFEYVPDVGKRLQLTQISNHEFVDFTMKLRKDDDELLSMLLLDSDVDEMVISIS